jgi:tyrosinase
MATYKEVATGGSSQRHLVGFESFLSRWHVSGCANCMTHLNVKTFVTLHGVRDDELNDPKVTFTAEVIPRLNKDGKTLIGANPVPKPKAQLGKRVY